MRVAEELHVALEVAEAKEAATHYFLPPTSYLLPPTSYFLLPTSYFLGGGGQGGGNPRRVPPAAYRASE